MEFKLSETFLTGYHSAQILLLMLLDLQTDVNILPCPKATAQPGTACSGASCLCPNVYCTRQTSARLQADQVIKFGMIFHLACNSKQEQFLACLQHICSTRIIPLDIKKELEHYLAYLLRQHCLLLQNLLQLVWLLKALSLLPFICSRYGWCRWLVASTELQYPGLKLQCFVSYLSYLQTLQ